MSRSDGLLDLLWGTLSATLLPLYAYVSVRRRGVPPTPPPRLPPTTESHGDGVRRVTRDVHEYNYSAAHRDYLVRRYALRWVILPFGLLSVAIAVVYLLGI